MKTLEKLISELQFSYPFTEKDLKTVYDLGQKNMLVELVKEIKGYPVNGQICGIIKEEQITEKMKELGLDKNEIM